MQSRRLHRLSRFRRNKRQLRQRLRQRIFFTDRVMPEEMDKPRVLVLTGAGFRQSRDSDFPGGRWAMGRA